MAAVAAAAAVETAGSGGAGGGGATGQAGAAGGGTAGRGGVAGGGTAGSSAGMGGRGGAGTTGTGGAAGGSSGAVTVQLDKTQQTIDGFGINNTYAPGMDDATAEALFDQTKGIGLSILRIGMSPNGSHANTASPQDITKAKACGAKYIIGSTWSPPKECKDNNNTQNGGHLLTSCYGSWSDTIAKFAKDNSLYAMSPANEPDFASCGTSRAVQRQLRYDALHGQRDGGFPQGGGTEAQGRGGQAHRARSIRMAPLLDQHVGLGLGSPGARTARTR